MEGRRYRRRMNGLVVAGAILVGVIIFLGVWGAIGNVLGGNSGILEDRGEAVIDVVYIQGQIGTMDYNHNWTVNRINELTWDSWNRGLMLYIDSPGGGVYASDELYQTIMNYKNETGRPVYAYFASEAASGGLYAGMAADKIYANRMSLTGSIGVIMSLTDTTGLQDLIGIKVENVVSGKNKAIGNPLTSEQREIIQGLIDEYYDIFIEVVATGRDLELEEVRKLADGRIYTPKQALELGLIDEIGTLDDALIDLGETHKLEHCNYYSNVPPEEGLMDLLSGFASTNLDTKGSLGQAEDVLSYIEDNNGVQFKYYYGN